MIRGLTGLRARLGAAFLAVALLASVLASGISYVLYRRMMLDRVQDEVLADVRQAIATEVPGELPPDAGQLLGERLEAVLTGRTGTPEALAASETGADGPTVVSEQGVGNGRRAAVLSVPPGGPVLLPDPGELHVPVDEEFARRALRETVYRRVVRNGTPYLLVGAYPAGFAATGSRRTVPPIVFVSVDLGREAADLRLFGRELLIADGASLAGARPRAAGRRGRPAPRP
ncbi:hypothetical protein, partial [Actinomadura sp. CNU-125]|uniref:hypothetical protein n=1 Tax=Actinomadura sp. CNU-125 TaxID=1904961 RepID=UPI0021CC9A2B